MQTKQVFRFRKLEIRALIDLSHQSNGRENAAMSRSSKSSDSPKTGHFEETNSSERFATAERRLGVVGALLSAIVVLALGLNVMGGEFQTEILGNSWLVAHIGSAVAALAIGAVILARKKGDFAHRVIGTCGAISLVLAAISSFWLHGLTGGLSPIHLLSGLILVSVPLAVLEAKRGNVSNHRQMIAQAYLGLILAGIFAFLPGRLFGSLFLGW